MDTEAVDLDAWPALLSGAGERTVRAALARGPERAGHAGALVAAAQAAALLGSRAARLLPGEAAVTAAVVHTVTPVLLGDGGRAVAGTPLIDRFPVLVHAFAAETADTARLTSAARLGAQLPERAANGQAPRGGCSIVQALPGAVRELAAPAPVVDRARALLAAGDELHRRMADVRSVTDPAAQPLARAYGTLFAAAACLHLWTANSTAAAGHPLWAEAGWLAGALEALTALLGGQLELPETWLAGLGLPPVGAATAPFGALLLAEAEAGRPLTPFDL